MQHLLRLQRNAHYQCVVTVLLEEAVDVMTAAAAVETVDAEAVTAVDAMTAEIAAVAIVMTVTVVLVAVTKNNRKKEQGIPEMFYSIPPIRLAAS